MIQMVQMVQMIQMIQKKNLDTILRYNIMIQYNKNLENLNEENKEP